MALSNQFLKIKNTSQLLKSVTIVADWYRLTGSGRGLPCLSNVVKGSMLSQLEGWQNPCILEAGL